MTKILVFAGTSDAKSIIERLHGQRARVVASVATAYGASMLSDLGIDILQGRMEKRQMAALIAREKIRLVIDATHPFAQTASQNIKWATNKQNCPCIRYSRLVHTENETQNHIVFAHSHAQAAGMAQEVVGNVLLTIGANNVQIYSQWIEADRLFARVLPTEESIARCKEAGISENHVIAGQGPFSREQNIRHLEESAAAVMVSKQSGRIGGVDEKIEAAGALSIPLILITPPSEEYGFDTIEQVVAQAKQYIE